MRIPCCIYAVIITKKDLNRIVCFISKEHSLPSGIKVTRGLKQIKKTWNVGTKFHIILSKQNHREEQSTLIKRIWIFVAASCFLDNVLLGCTGLH